MDEHGEARGDDPALDAAETEPDIGDAARGKGDVGFIDSESDR